MGPRELLWYHGLAIGPMAQVSQVQLAQPVMTICWAAVLLGEQLTWATVVGGLAVILCAGAAVRVRLNRRPASSWSCSRSRAA
jgi:drug/metabolite transporter (DMT)-like permease